MTGQGKLYCHKIADAYWQCKGLDIIVIFSFIVLRGRRGAKKVHELARVNRGSVVINADHEAD